MSKKVLVKEAAGMLGVTPHYVRQLIKAGKLSAYRPMPSKTYVYTASIEAMIDENNNNK